MTDELKSARDQAAKEFVDEHIENARKCCDQCSWRAVDRSEWLGVAHKDGFEKAVELMAVKIAEMEAENRRYDDVYESAKDQIFNLESELTTLRKQVEGMKVAFCKISDVRRDVLDGYKTHGDLDNAYIDCVLKFTELEQHAKG